MSIRRMRSGTGSASDGWDDPRFLRCLRIGHSNLQSRPLPHADNKYARSRVPFTKFSYGEAGQQRASHLVKRNGNECLRVRLAALVTNAENRESSAATNGTALVASRLWLPLSKWRSLCPPLPIEIARQSSATRLLPRSRSLRTAGTSSARALFFGGSLFVSSRNSRGAPEIKLARGSPTRETVSWSIKK